MSDDVLREAKKYYDLGFKLIWIAEGVSKRPASGNLGWSKKENVKTWQQLKSSYAAGSNVAVVLEHTKIDGASLCCIDLDVKIPDQGFLEEALKKLEGLTGGVKCPTVLTGSGGGRRHTYCLIDEPLPMITVMKDARGELVIYSKGRFILLPPSKTKGLYKWETPLSTGLPRLSFSHLVGMRAGPPTTKKEAGTSSVPTFYFSPEVVELWRLELPDRILKGIVDGPPEGSDRSAFIFEAAKVLARLGLSENAVISVLSDPANRVSDTARDHTQGGGRDAQARWLSRYTAGKVMAEEAARPKPCDVFTDEPNRVLSFDEIAEQDEWLRDPEPSWVSALARGFYKKSKGGKTPMYCELLSYYDHLHQYRSIADMKGVYVFNGTHFEYTSPQEIKNFAEYHMRPGPSEKLRYEFLCKVLVNNMRKREFFTKTIEGKINFKNGVLDIASGELLPHSPAFGFRGVLPYDYDPKAECPVFDRWLRGLMLDDMDLVCTLQEYMGYVVTGGEYKYHKALWLEGVGRNGKSTFIDLLKALIGPNNYSVLSIKALVSDKFAGAELDGKFANFSEETSPEELKDSGPFKNLTSGGDILAQKKYGDPYHFRSRAKLIMTYNEIPDLKDLSAGMLSRPIIVPFRKEIKENEQDRNIKTKLFSELPGIFNFALRGWVRLEHQNRFTIGEVSRGANSRVKEESCNAYQWVENRVVKEYTDRRYSSLELYQAYRHAEKYAYSQKKFERRINAHPTIREAHKRGEKGMFYTGISLK